MSEISKKAKLLSLEADSGSAECKLYNAGFIDGVKYAEQQLKNCNLQNIVWQSEQLLAFAQFLHNHSYVNKGFKPETLVRRFKGE